MGVLEDAKREVLRATDIVTLIEPYVPLKRSGRSLVGLCPFHQEKSPSFHVSSERQTFKCFGCGKGGNAIDFLIEREGVDFKSALRVLADRAGIRLPEGRRAPGERSDAEERLRLFEILSLAAAYFRQALLRGKTAGHARDYVRSRGIDEETEERFEIGWAPAGWSFLLDFLRGRGYAPAEVERAGLALPKKSGNGHVDRFRNRLMFPIHDVMGRVVSFGGRALAKDDVPKYMNGPETPVFRKGELVYGLHLAKEAARARGQVAVVEGYVDVVLAHQAGFPWMVATLGTAFRAEHARTLARIAPRLLVFFDGDAAGAAANRRGLVEAGRAGLRLFQELKVARLPDGLDPADIVQQRGPAALAESVASAVSLSEFFLAAAGEGSAAKAKAVDEVSEVLAALDDEAYREIEIAATAHRFGVPEEVVRRAVRRHRDQAAAREAQAPSQAPERAPVARPGASDAGPPGAPPPPPAPLPKVERWALEALLAAPALLDDARARGIDAGWFSDARAQAILAALAAGEPLATIADDAARATAAEIAASVDVQKDYAREWGGVVALLSVVRAERSEPRGTKRPEVELQETDARKRRRLDMQRRMSLRGGDA
jgi:DNA primase